MAEEKNTIEENKEDLNKENKDDFRTFVNNEVSFNPHNMFICKSKNLLTSN